MSISRTKLVYLSIAVCLSLIAPAAIAYTPEWVLHSATSVPFSGKGVRAGDLTGDGRPDVVVRTSTQLYVALTNSDGTINAPVFLYQGTTISDMVLADFNGDGKLDVVAADLSNNSIIALAGNGDGTFGSPVTTALTIVPNQLAVGDFNGDTHPELLVRTTTGPAMVIFTSDGGLQFTQLTSTSLTASPYRAVVGDVDGDGKNDVVVGCGSPVGFQIFFGKNDGTFDAPVSVTSAPTASADIVLADMNADGRLDIVSCEYSANTVTTVLNSGARSFGSPVSHEVRVITALIGSPTALAVIDATDDGKPDAVMLLANSEALATVPGNGDGTFGDPQASFSDNIRFGYGMALGDFSGDGKMDLVTVASATHGLAIMRNAPGESVARIQAHNPTITTGQTEVFDVYAAPSANIYYGLTPPSGSITVKDDGTEVGSGTVPADLTVSASSLALGNHAAITAAYGGDSNFRSSESTPISVNVVSDVTTVTLTKNYPAGDVQYSEPMQLIGAATCSIPGALYGSFFLYTDGQRSEYSQGGPPTYWYIQNVTPGTHTFYITYEGDATHPPGKSNTITQVITKADSAVRFDFMPATARYGEQPKMEMSLNAAKGTATPSGNLHLYEGNTLLGTMYADNSCCSGGLTVFFQFPVMSVGVHYVYVVYDGNDLFNPSQTVVGQYTVLPNLTLPISVYVSSTQLSVYGFVQDPLASYHNYTIHRRINAGPWSVVQTGALYPTWTELNPAAGSVYTYFMEGFDSSNHLLATSNVASATLVSFTDDPLLTSTPVKALHLTEVVSGVNVYRSAAGLQPLVFADIGPGLPVRAAHIAALQNGLNEALAVLGSNPAAWPGGTPVFGGMIKAQHVQDLREAMR